VEQYVGTIRTIVDHWTEEKLRTEDDTFKQLIRDMRVMLSRWDKEQRRGPVQ
jgi:hypothetical protein